MKPEKESLAHRLMRLRIGKQLSTGDVARLIGVSPSTYREWEYGRTIRGEPYEKLALALRVSLIELMTGERYSANKALSLVTSIESQVHELRIELMKTAALV